jgi:hypothetical protein
MKPPSFSALLLYLLVFAWCLIPRAAGQTSYETRAPIAGSLPRSGSWTQSDTGQRWFSWTAPASAWYQFRVDQSREAYALLYVHYEHAPGQLTEVGKNNGSDPQVPVTFYASAGASVVFMATRYDDFDPAPVTYNYTLSAAQAPATGVSEIAVTPPSIDATGATAHRTGPNVMAQALTLHYHCGLPLSKVPAVIAAATGIRLTQSALTQAAAGLAAEGGVVHTAYQELRAAVPASAVVNTDDTGWRIGGAGAFLMGFFTPLLAVFQIRRQLIKQLRDRRLKDTDHQRLLGGIGRQHDRGRVLLFLEHPEIEPTINRAERGLRGAVIARKVSHCSKNERGAQTYEAMKSETATHALRGHSVARALADLIQGMPMPAAVAR